MGISIRNISKAFGTFAAVDNVSFDVRIGELVALLGPSGCGKSTILRIIAGLERPDSGSVFLNGKNVDCLTPQQRSVGFVFQHYALFKHMTAEKNIAFGLEIQKKPRREISDRVSELIHLVGLEGYAGHYPAQLSGGQRQRVALARALASEPGVLLLDEPFGALDAKVRENLTIWLRQLHDKLNTTSIFVTHDQNEAMELSDKIVVINKGRVEQTGTGPEVYERPHNRFVASFIGNVNVLDGTRRNGFICIRGGGCKIRSGDAAPGTGRDVVVFVRPEDVVVAAQKKAADAFPALVRNIHYKGSYREVDLQVEDFVLKAFEYKNHTSEYTWRKNQAVFVTLKTFRVFDPGQGEGKLHDQLEQFGYIE